MSQYRTQRASWLAHRPTWMYTLFTRDDITTVVLVTLGVSK
jgi:hypothetical protein